MSRGTPPYLTELVGQTWLRPAPPPRDSEHHRPAMAKCSPEREERHRKHARWFQEWCDKNGISIRDLSRILGVQLAVAAKKRSGESPLNTTDISLFRSRARRELTFAFLLYCDAEDAASDNEASHG